MIKLILQSDVLKGAQYILTILNYRGTPYADSNGSLCYQGGPGPFRR